MRVYTLDLHNDYNNEALINIMDEFHYKADYSSMSPLQYAREFGRTPRIIGKCIDIHGLKDIETRYNMVIVANLCEDRLPI